MFTQISLKTQLQERALLDAVCYNYSWSALAHNVLIFWGRLEIYFYFEDIIGS